LIDIAKEMCYRAKDEMNCDALSAMIHMDNTPEIFNEKLNFLNGDGCLHFYFVNWSMGEIDVKENDLGTILV